MATLDIFVSVFILAALAFIFAHAWNMTAEQTLKVLAKRDDSGDVTHPLRQTLIYALMVTIMCAVFLWYIHHHTDINLGAGHGHVHR
jgi:ABC-type Fe3+ transport system permease subunit